MKEYRAYIAGSDDHVQARIDLVDADDENTARKQAEQLVDGYDIELWQLDRKVATFRFKP
jgi:hypothetical protein